MIRILKISAPAFARSLVRKTSYQNFAPQSEERASAPDNKNSEDSGIFKKIEVLHRVFSIFLNLDLLFIEPISLEKCFMPVIT
jgi:hypothetical protein